MTPIWTRLNVETLLTQFIAWLPGLLSAIVILIAFWLGWRFSRPVLARILSRAGLDQALAGLVLSAYRFTISTFGMIMAINQIGINVGAALAGLGVIGLTIGFAARDSLSNIMAGFLILWDKPFHSGDWVTLGDKYGKVEEITMRTTRLHTWNNARIIIPNQTVINEVLVNHSSNGRIRIEVPIAMPAQGNVSAYRKAIVEVVRRVEGVMDDPPPNVVVKSLGSASIDLLIYAWVANAEQELPIQYQILENTAHELIDSEQTRHQHSIA
jgi:small conductance mechanosensitive channel